LSQTLQIISIYSTGHLDSVILEEHRKEILRYLYNHQVHFQVDVEERNQYMLFITFCFSIC